MSQPQLIAIGTSQAFRQQVGRVMDDGSDGVTWLPSVTTAEEMILSTREPFDLALVGPEVKETDAFGFADFVATQAPTTAVVLVRDYVSAGTLAAAMRSGIRDVVDLSQGAQEFSDALARALSWAASVRTAAPGVNGSEKTSSSRAHLYSVFSSKGGTGKTFLATNLAVAISELTGKDTAVVDLDLDMGDVFSYFGREPVASIHDLVELGDPSAREKVRETGVRLGDHIWAFGAPADPSSEAPSGDAVGKLLRAIRGEFSYVVVDTSTDFTDSALSCFDLSDAICLISGLDVVGVRHLAKSLETLLSIGLPEERFKVVLNRGDSKVGLEKQDVERVMKLKVDATIPSSRLVPAALNKGRPLYWDDPRSAVSQAIADFARSLVGQKSSDGNGIAMSSVAVNGDRQGVTGSNGSGSQSSKAKKGGLFSRR